MESLQLIYCSSFPAGESETKENEHEKEECKIQIAPIPRNSILSQIHSLLVGIELLIACCFWLSFELGVCLFCDWMDFGDERWGFCNV